MLLFLHVHLFGPLVTVDHCLLITMGFTVVVDQC